MSTPASIDDDVSRPLGEGLALLRAGSHREALEIARRLLDEHEPTPETLLFCGEVHFSRAEFIDSEKVARRYEELFPDDYGGPVLRCRALMAQGRLGEARDLAISLADKDITVDAHIEILVTILSGCMVPDAAYPLCRKAIGNDPYNPAAHRRLALTCRLIGKLDEAAEAANIALRFDAHDYEMIGLRSSLKRATPEENHIVELETLLAAGCRNPLGAARVACSLAKELEDIGRHDRAFKFLQAGAGFKRKTIKYDVRDDVRMMQLLAAACTGEALAESEGGAETNEPIFILGLPRTGSTLLERVLSSHSAVYAAGELNHLSGAMMEAIRKLGPMKSREEIVARSLVVDHRAVGERYIERTRPFTGHTPHFIDKLPGNFMMIGTIHLALPNAKVIHVRRAPIDACYAIYKFLFNEAYAWSYDLNELTRYYIAYHKLMDHWRTVLPGRVLEIAYEDMVADLEPVACRLVADLGLEWEDACLQFHRNEAAAMTGSAAQVRQKIYSSSVGRWRDYEDHLQPVIQALESAGIDPYTP
jgi:tetratricopeptide (TPR) repeat protein